MPSTPSSPDASPEIALLLAAARGTGPLPDAVNRALSSAPDWTRLIQLGLHHRLTPALLQALEVADPALVPHDLLLALREHSGALRRQSGALRQALSELLDVLEQRSIVAIPFKGPFLGEWLFGDVSLRSPGDLDILVMPADVSHLCEVLEQRGFVDADRGRGASPMTPGQRRLYQRVQCEYRFVRESDGLIVEPHWALSQRALAVDIDYPAMFGRARQTVFADRAVLMLAADDLLLALCIHGAKHHWDRLAWIRDVAALLAKVPDLDVQACLASAARIGCARVLLLGLALARDYAGAHLSAAVTRLIDDDPKVLALEREVVGAFADDGRPEPRNDRIESFRWMMRERWSDRLRYGARTWLSPRRHHIETVVLPGPLRFGYYPLKWVLDFAVLPVWSRWKRAAGDGRTGDDPTR